MNCQSDTIDVIDSAYLVGDSKLASVLHPYGQGMLGLKELLLTAIKSKKVTIAICRRVHL
jgi:hypothetical protein